MSYVHFIFSGFVSDEGTEEELRAKWNKALHEAAHKISAQLGISVVEPDEEYVTDID